MNVFPFWHAILQPVLTITMNKMRKNETQLMNDYIMAGHAIVVVKDINLLFYHGNAVILTL